MVKVGLGTQISPPTPKLKWSQNEAKRLALLETDMEVIRVHYLDKKTYLCGQDRGVPCTFCTSDEHKYRFAINCILYKPDASGAFTQFEVKIWQFGQKVYEALKRLKEQWGSLQNQDLYVSCSNEQFQNLEVQICPESIWKRGDCGQPAEVQTKYSQSRRELGPFLLKGVQVPGQAPSGGGAPQQYVQPPLSIAPPPSPAPVPAPLVQAPPSAVPVSPPIAGVQPPPVVAPVQQPPIVNSPVQSDTSISSLMSDL